MNGRCIFAASLVMLAFWSCKRSKTETPDPDNPTPKVTVDYEMERISKPEWLIYKVDVSGTDFWQLPGVFQTCMKDDTYRFYKDSVLTTFENKNVCSGNPDSTRSDWQFIDGRKKVAANFLGLRDTADIVLLTDSTMNLFVNYTGTEATVFFKKK